MTSGHELWCDIAAEMLKRLLTVRIDDDVVISALQFYSTPHPQPSKRVLELRMER